MHPELSGRQRGQALIEALVGCALLLLLLLAVVVIGKYHAVDLAAAQAARQLAFNCGFQPDACEGESGLAPESDAWRDRLVGNSKLDFFHRQLWVNRQGAPMLEQASDVSLKVSRNAFDAMPGSAKSGPKLSGKNPVELISDLAGPGKFGLEIGAGLLTSHAQLNLFAASGESKPEDIFNNMALQPKAGAAILTDAWNASGPYGGRWSVHARVDKGWRVNKRLDQVVRAGYAATKLEIKAMKVMGIEDQADEFKHGEIPMDLVPLDRLPESEAAQ